MLKLPVAGKEVGIFFTGQGVEIFSVGSTQSPLSTINGCGKLVAAILPFLLPSLFATKGHIVALT